MTRLRRYFSLHRGLTIAVASTAVLALGAGAAYAAVSSGSSATPVSNSAIATPTTLPATTPATGSATGKAHPRLLRGKVTVISGNTWTVETRAGTAVTVEVTSTTQFGTKAAPSSPSSFAVGDAIAVVGPRTSPTTVTARRIVGAHPARGATAPTSPTTTGAASD
jgi:Domain of unknown function (DUF5666)